MKTFSTDTRHIDAHLHQRQEGGEAALFEARLLLDDDLREKVRWQQKTYHLVRQYGRRQLKAEIEAVHQQLFQRPEHASFRQKVLRWFTARD
ncbi:hypothetical protein SAMN05421823_107152 [Catalinimonas alkaloidigena]|uniref:Uncharacterized protein n=1 Tax=Catalinimonas alkaloidigena TaxID=1075417 RepID=A0A1G9LTW6_9BACT|nr:hypothetical protein [Catalinimonas alkaloidigena]SDL64865.1 hypothetical protein SAMN05421823_107152 [Catalinimonas alkaloidigena]